MEDYIISDKPKGCPFCGGCVIFEVESPYRIYHGKCTECGNGIEFL